MDSDLPAGVVTPRPAVGLYSGIYRKQGAELCCWITQDASFQVHIPRFAKVLIATVALPEMSLFRSRPQGLTIKVPGERPKSFPNLPVGQSELRVPLTGARKDRIVTVSVHAEYAFVPKRENINGDTRVLSLYLTGMQAK